MNGRTGTPPFHLAEQIADAVLYEGYVLYPYRASAAKNQYRWQFGVVAPRLPAGDGEPWCSQTECLVQPAADTACRLAVRVRCLRPEPAAAPTDNERGSSRASAWLAGVPYAEDLELTLPSPPWARELRLVAGGVRVRLCISTEAADGFTRLRVRLENLEPWEPRFDRDRDAMLCRALVGTHLLLAVDGGRFVSLLEPPEAAARAADGCRNLHTWPVLVGDRTRQDLMLSSPIVLYDFPAVAGESQGDLCDAAEIDEILTLRILTMSDEEKREARQTDPRARAILDRIETMPREALAALHGRLRSADFFNPPGTPAPDAAFVVVGGVRIARGSRIRLRPNRRADAMDMFLRDQPATVAGVYRDVDDRVYVAVTVDADPAAPLHDAFGRYFYFDPAEVEPLDVEQQECA